MENGNIESTANYSYETILNTFKFCSQEIHKALKTKSWTSEQHKFNYILKIVEGNINNVYMRMKNVEKAKEEAKNTTVDTANHTGAEYQKKTKEMTNKLLNDLNVPFNELNADMRAIVRNSGTDWNGYSKKDKTQIYKCVQVAQSVKMVLDTSLLSEDGKLCEQSQETLDKGRDFLESLSE